MDIYKGFLEDLLVLLKEDALDAKKERDKHSNISKDDFYNGVLHGYYGVFDTIKNQLIAFEIDPEEVGFDIDPDKDLI